MNYLMRHNDQTREKYLDIDALSRMLQIVYSRMCEADNRGTASATVDYNATVLVKWTWDCFIKYRLKSEEMDVQEMRSAAAELVGMMLDMYVTCSNSSADNFGGYGAFLSKEMRKFSVMNGVHLTLMHVLWNKALVPVYLQSELVWEIKQQIIEEKTKLAEKLKPMSVGLKAIPKAQLKLVNDLLHVLNRLPDERDFQKQRRLELQREKEEKEQRQQQQQQR
ncbi:MAG: hypothetical protein MHM6MM_009492, partial [Cercozoa sp. M6MM]